MKRDEKFMRQSAEIIDFKTVSTTKEAKKMEAYPLVEMNEQVEIEESKGKYEAQNDFLVIRNPQIFYRLKGRKATVYAALCQFVNPSDGRCWPSIIALSKVLSMGRNHVHVALKSLVLLGYVKKGGKRENGTNILYLPHQHVQNESLNSYDNRKEQPDLDDNKRSPKVGLVQEWDQSQSGTKSSPKVGPTTSPGMGPGTDHKRTDKITDQTKTPIVPKIESHPQCAAEAARPIPPSGEASSRQNKKDLLKAERKASAKRVIDHLNAKTGKQYQHLPASLDPVIARLNEGYTEQDCFTAVDNKVADWLHDPKMNKYLRPSTIFCKKHFDAYVNEGRKPKAKPKPKYERPTDIGFDPMHLQTF